MPAAQTCARAIGVDASPITQRLWVGSAPIPGADYGACFDMIYLVSAEYQLPPGAFPDVSVRRMPFDDSMQPTREDLATAWLAAESVARNIRRGRRVLVTCSLGRNRSALVAALALHLLTGQSGAFAMATVQARRVDRLGVHALANPAFRQYLLEL